MSLLKEKRQVLQAVQRLFDMLSRKGTTPTQSLMPRKHKARIVLAKWTVFLCLFCLCEARSFSRQLENVPLRCCAAVSYPTVYRDESKEPYKFGGIAMEYLLKLQDVLGFRCISLDIDDGGDEGVPFNSIVEKMDRCVTEEGTMREDPDCNCDMAVGGWMESDTRLGKVDFLPPFLIDGIGIATHVDETSVASAGAFFLTAFSLAVWGLLVMLSVVFTFLKMLDRRFVPPDDSYTPLPASEPRLRRIRHYLLKSRIPYRLRKALQSTLSRMVGFGNSDPVTDKESSRQWVLNLLIACCSLFIILAYESSMTATLVQGKIESKYRTLEDLQNCHVDPRSVCVPRGGAMQTFWDTVVASRACHKEYKDGAIFVDSYEEGAKKLSEKTCKFLMTTATSGTGRSQAQYCGVMAMTGEMCIRTGASFLLPRGSNLTEPMARETLRMSTAASIPGAEQFMKAKCAEGGPASLSLKQLFLFFMVAFGACFVVFLVMILDPQGASPSKTGDIGASISSV